MFDSWSGKIPHVAGQLSTRATVTDEACTPGVCALQREKPELERRLRSLPLEKALAVQRGPGAARQNETKNKTRLELSEQFQVHSKTQGMAER